MLANLLQDVRYALHGFTLRPMFAVVVVLTLSVDPVVALRAE